MPVGQKIQFNFDQYLMLVYLGALLQQHACFFILSPIVMKSAKHHVLKGRGGTAQSSQA